MKGDRPPKQLEMCGTERIACIDPQAEPKQTVDMGLGLFATSKIRPGANVFAITANFATVLDTPRLKDTCSNCFVTVGDEVNPGLTLKACTGCRVVKYCNERCQTESWAASHKKECSIYRKCHPNILPMHARAVLSMISEPDNRILKGMYRTHHTAVDTLGDHFTEMMELAGEQIERVLTSAEGLKEISNTDVGLPRLVRYFTMLETNAFTLTNRYFDRIGLCMLPFASYANHSCEPNAYIGFDGPVIYLKALQDIALDEQIFISYIDNTEPWGKRQSELQKRYFFTCKCPKCAQGQAAREDQYLNAEGPPTSAPEKVAWDIVAMPERPGLTPNALIVQDLAALTMLQSTGCFPITRQPYPHVHDDFIVQLLEAKRYRSAFLPTLIRYLHMDPVLYPSRYHPIRKRNTWALAKLVRCINDRTVHDRSPPTTNYDNFGDHFPWIYYSLLCELVEIYDDSLGLQNLLKLQLREISDELERHGIDFSTANERRLNKILIDNAWKDVKSMVDRQLSKLVAMGGKEGNIYD
ncbi:uncharacterized protein PADG_11427 [Paracoccidioides brasiliensis Pb18]|uniref:Uncharacterized protein n=1 Tax=Paracoccidioides brasiliensis (strain Pb18) TaxID=502780 RepID=A0A0A0HV98_PARBD|nr:uncharacterized protein PADG_11427 [Paracoccidioides brasiliensis Pb18]KGM92243.1 hypothetical protein PADG_11427 [Paracoccidioides brasiliensis Pb18]